MPQPLERHDGRLSRPIGQCQDGAWAARWADEWSGVFCRLSDWWWWLHVWQVTRADGECRAIPQLSQSAVLFHSTPDISIMSSQIASSSRRSRQWRLGKQWWWALAFSYCTSLKKNAIKDNTITKWNTLYGPWHKSIHQVIGCKFCCTLRDKGSSVVLHLKGPVTMTNTPDPHSSSLTKHLAHYILPSRSRDIEQCNPEPLKLLSYISRSSV